MTELPEIAERETQAEGCAMPPIRLAARPGPIHPSGCHAANAWIDVFSHLFSLFSPRDRGVQVASY